MSHIKYEVYNEITGDIISVESRKMDAILEIRTLMKQRTEEEIEEGLAFAWKRVFTLDGPDTYYEDDLDVHWNIVVEKVIYKQVTVLDKDDTFMLCMGYLPSDPKTVQYFLIKLK